VPPPGSLALKLLNKVTGLHTNVYRLTRGKIGGRMVGAPVLLLDHVGRKSGQHRTTPLLYLEDGENLVIVASRGGSQAPPAWWLNIEAAPETMVQVGRERRRVAARTASPEEKKVLWPRLVDLYRDYATYQQRTERDIPVVILSPAG